jgi:hypothetical protein
MKCKLALVISLLVLAALLKQAACVGSTPETLDHAAIAAGGHRGAGLAAAGLLDYSWDGWRPATCMPERCFCEPIHAGAIRQPVNTWSNLGFVFVGLLAIAIASHDLPRAARWGSSNLIRTRPVYPAVYGTAAVLIGIGSMFYHSSLAFAGQVVDVISMYLMTSFMVLYNVSRTRRMSDRTFLASYLAVNGALGYASIAWPVLRRYIFVALMVAVLVSEWVVRRTRRPKVNAAFLCGALASLVGACTMWVLDVTRVLCSPGGWFQGHAVWHVLMAAVIGFVYLYYRSEAGYETACGASGSPSPRACSLCSSSGRSVR